MQKNYEVIWYNCLQIVKDNIPKVSFNTWFKPIAPIKLEQNVLTIQVPSAFFYEYIEEHYIDLLKKALRTELGNNAKLEYSVVIDNSNINNAVESSSKQMTLPGANIENLNNRPVRVEDNKKGGLLNPYMSPGIKKIRIDSQLNSNKNFDNFIEGKCNRIARSAGMAIGSNPGSTFNPMFIYAEPGMGKTHLAQAVGIEVKKNFKEEKTVLYVAAHKFQTQYSEATRNNKRNDFIHFYQAIDVLIIDDIQEFAGKSGTQDVFFHIFNNLHQAGKQLILTSDRQAMELKGISQRLISRFKWGLQTEITAPEFETRLSIVKNKARNEGLELSNEIINYIAKNISGNVRELEGAIISLIAHSTYIKEDITFEFATSIIDKLSKKPQKDISINYIRKVVCDYFNLPIEAIQTKSRKREIVQARQIAMYFSKKYTKASLSTIGSEIGNKDHATVLYANRTVNNLKDTDKIFKTLLTEIEKKIHTS